MIHGTLINSETAQTLSVLPICYLHKFVDSKGNDVEGTFIDDATRAKELKINNRLVQGTEQQKKTEFARFCTTYLSVSQCTTLQKTDVFIGLSDDFGSAEDSPTHVAFSQTSLCVYLTCEANKHVTVTIIHEGKGIQVFDGRNFLGYMIPPNSEFDVKYTTQLSIYGAGIVVVNTHIIEYDQRLAKNISLKDTARPFTYT